MFSVGMCLGAFQTGDTSFSSCLKSYQAPLLYFRIDEAPA